MNAVRTYIIRAALGALLVAPLPARAQQILNEAQHTRGRLWENVANDGWVGSLGAWDYLVSLPLGLFPGFPGWVHPVGNEFNAVNTFANANMHNFRSGVWIVARNVNTPGQPPTYSPTLQDYDAFTSGLQDDTHGEEATRAPLVVSRNFAEVAGFNPLLPEEMITGTWHTNLGITVTRRSYAWSFPGYQDFIIYDYIFKNTGKIVSTLTGTVIPDEHLAKFRQTIHDAYFVIHSGISVSTKSQINFHTELTAVQAGAFGWLPEAYHDFYHLVDDGTLAFSTNINGGKEPMPNDQYPTKDIALIRSKFGLELESPAAFGWLSLYASPTGAAPRSSMKPDVLRIDSHKGGSFRGGPLDMQGFVSGRPKKDFWDFASTPDTQVTLGNSGHRMNFYTFSYGPYTLAPDDSVRIIVAEIAGVMDMNEVLAGDPNAHFPDSSIAAVRRNAENARNAVKWGLGASVNGIPLAGDVPEPPPAPITDAVNASFGTEKAAIAITWGKEAESATLTDGSGGVYYNGATDLDGYRVYKSTDFQFTSDTEPPAFRGEAWTLLADIPITNASHYLEQSSNKYRFVDTTVVFGFRYGYYVSAYRNAQPGKTWTSANGTVLNGLPALASGSGNKTPPAGAAPGPVLSMDIFVAPNPYVYGDPDRSFGTSNVYGIEFRNLPERATIRIYTVMGDLVKILEHAPDARGNVYGSEPWDQKTDSGLLVAPGLYIYNVQAKVDGVDKSLTGKLMIVR